MEEVPQNLASKVTQAVGRFQPPSNSVSTIFAALWPSGCELGRRTASGDFPPLSTFAILLLAFVGLSDAARAETGTVTWRACDPAAASGQAGETCLALRAAYLARVNECKAARKAAADRAAGSTRANGPHPSRARHLLCSAEVRDGMGLAAK